jgi:hypothetical protein
LFLVTRRNRVLFSISVSHRPWGISSWPFFAGEVIDDTVACVEPAVAFFEGCGGRLSRLRRKVIDRGEGGEGSVDLNSNSNGV